MLFQPGQVVIAEDTTGKGHKSSSVSNMPRKSLFITY